MRVLRGDLQSGGDDDDPHAWKAVVSAPAPVQPDGRHDVSVVSALDVPSPPRCAGSTFPYCSSAMIAVAASTSVVPVVGLILPFFTEV